MAADVLKQNTGARRLLLSVRPLGTGQIASRLGLGTHSLHRLLLPSARRRLLAAAYDLGIRYFDTAPSYGAGLAEREIGQVLSKRRSELILATKFGIAPGRLATVVPAGAYLTATAGAALKLIRLKDTGRNVPRRDYSTATMRQSVEGSLRRLRTDYIDVLYLHAPVVDCPVEADQLASALEALRTAGKIRYAGLSGDVGNCLAIARGCPDLAEVLQLEVPADPQGAPSAAPLPPEVSIGFWEFPAPFPGQPERPLAQTLDQLHRAVPSGMILLSTRNLTVIEEATKQLRGAERASGSSPAPESSS